MSQSQPVTASRAFRGDLSRSVDAPSSPTSRRFAPPDGPPTTMSDPYDIVRSVATVVKGHTRAIELTVVALLAEGHVLIEDMPGVGKTTLARALAASIDCSVSRVQFTPDLLPSDITGVSIYRPQTGAFEFTKGPIFANIVIADEINRASPKTQSAMLESMQEGSATVDGTTYLLPRPFMVVATQNPYEMEGTYPLPEAQRDRFMMRLSLGYPGYDDEVLMLDSQELRDPLDAIQPVVNAAEVTDMIASVRALHASRAVKQYIVDLARATREMPGVTLGVSPRAGIQLLRAAKAVAALGGRGYVLPDDVQKMVPYVWGHRLVHGRSVTDSAIEEGLRKVLASVKVR